jgi:hypothetical protein
MELIVATEAELALRIGKSIAAAAVAASSSMVMSTLFFDLIDSDRELRRVDE